MARDRQRAKQRRKRQRGAGGPRGGSRARDRARHRARRRDVDDAGLGEHARRAGPAEARRRPTSTRRSWPSAARSAERRRRRRAPRASTPTSSSTTTSSARPTTRPRATGPEPAAAAAPPRSRTSTRPRASGAAASSPSSGTASTSCAASSGRTAARSARPPPSSSASSSSPAAIWPAGRHLEAARRRHPLAPEYKASMFRWYVINTYSGHENKVKQNLEHRVVLAQPAARRAPGRRADRDRPGDEGQPEDLRREAHHARLRAGEHGPQRGLLAGRQGHARRDRLRRRLQRADPADPGRGRPPAAPRGRGPRARAAPSSRSASPSRSSPARCRTSPARSPRSTRTRASSRCWYPSSGARPRSRSATTR